MAVLDRETVEILGRSKEYDLRIERLKVASKVLSTPISNGVEMSESMQRLYENSVWLINAEIEEGLVRVGAKREVDLTTEKEKV